jgi:hypothetical protein
VKRLRFRHEVVAALPEALRPSVLYVTADGDVAGHLCACGCGREVITPLSPTDWSIDFGQQGATLMPSIGNWAFPCRSHYFIENGAVWWAGDMSNRAIALGRHRDKASKQRYYERQQQVPTADPPPATEAASPPPTVDVPARKISVFAQFWAWCRRLRSG